MMMMMMMMMMMALKLGTLKCTIQLPVEISVCYVSASTKYSEAKSSNSILRELK
jgi:hypothetical protein